MTEPFPLDQTPEKALAKRVVAHMTYLGATVVGFCTAALKCGVELLIVSRGGATKRLSELTSTLPNGGRAIADTSRKQKFP